ncbi:hypothetical protein BJQ89_00460 [Arthrobacter sp. ES1]|nr:hypothetical protein [Arthrobacter sp. ES1]
MIFVGTAIGIVVALALMAKRRLAGRDEQGETVSSQAADRSETGN